MISAFRAFTPKVRPLNYDSLASDLGCQDINGVKVNNFEPLSRICVAEVGASSPPYLLKPDTTSYFMGPATAPGPPLFMTVWACWVATAGVRAGRYSWITPPSDNLGELSHLWPYAKDATMISGAFNINGFMAIAIQASKDTIMLRYFIDAEGAIDDEQWPGRSPLLWFIGQLHIQEDAGGREVVAMYLNPDDPTTIYGRFESEGYATEHKLVQDLPVNMVKIVHAQHLDGRLVIYGFDDEGRAISIYSNFYAVEGTDRETLEVEWVSGYHEVMVVPVEPLPDKSTLALQWVKGYHFPAVVGTAQPTNADQNKAALGLEWVEGSHI